MNERIQELIRLSAVPSDQAEDYALSKSLIEPAEKLDVAKFAELIVRECIEKIETYRIPVGNSSSGELACEWTYDALKEIRDDIKETFGIEK